MYLLFEEPSEYSLKNSSLHPEEAGAQEIHSSQQTTGSVVSALPKVAYLFVNAPVVIVQALSKVASSDSCPVQLS